MFKDFCARFGNYQFYLYRYKKKAKKLANFKLNKTL